MTNLHAHINCNDSYYIDMSVLLENTCTPLIKFIQKVLYLGQELCISSLVKISMISLVSSLSLKLYLNLLVYDRNIFRSSSKVCSNLRQSLEIFGKFLRTFVWPSEQFWKIFRRWLEIFGKSSKMPSSVCLYNKRTLHIISKKFKAVFVAKMFHDL